MKAATLLSVVLCLTPPCHAASPAQSLHDSTVAALVTDLSSTDPALRAAAAENLGFLRAYAAADTLAAATTDSDTETRREACLSLAWCGARTQVPTLLTALADRDWSVRQAAWVALTNLTGMEFPFDSHAAEPARAGQIKRWRAWWSSVPATGLPPELLALLDTPPNDLAENCPVTTSSTYKGPPSVLTDPAHAGFWQTKNVPFPQHCTIDLGQSRKVGGVTISQYGEGFRMTDFSISVSDDGESFRELLRKRELTPTDLAVSFSKTTARFLRITSHASERPIYPTTFHRVSVFEDRPDKDQVISPFLLRERAMRAIGCLGGRDASSAIVPVIKPYATRAAAGTEEKLMVQAGIRALGRLRDQDGHALLVRLLGQAYWARYAADALGDFGGDASAVALINAYPAVASDLDRKPPANLPGDDKPGFEAVDRMYKAPHAISLALTRFTFESDALRRQLREISPLLVANMAGDFDGAMLYEEQAYQKVTAYLLDCAGVRREVTEIAFEALGQSSSGSETSLLPDHDRTRLLALAKSAPGGTSFAAGWLTALCRDKRDLPRLLDLLQHNNGWVRINAAKTLTFINDPSAADTIASQLAASMPEAEHGYFNGFLFDKKQRGQGEYNAPSPRWREAFTRALGQLGNDKHVPLLVRLLDDERNALEVRYSAAASLAKIGSPSATTELTKAATEHPFHSIRLLAREALWKRNLSWDQAIPNRAGVPPTKQPVESPGDPAAIVFIKGDNDMPNDFQIDIWRQSYSTTDSGPTYRLGQNLHLLKPATSSGSVTPLTSFTDGYVADCEVSWDGGHVVFARRDADQPWWHIWELALESGALHQLTHGPHHDVQPTYLPDGRIVFSSSRTGMRDEYHGYPATGLTVMNRDGSDIRCIGFNLGRDNEPAIMPDGRILFSRLELFYSRLKTELTVQTMLPDGTMNRTIYGPEKRDLWRNQTRLSGEKGWGEAPPRHRVLRLTQPQPLDNERVIVATTGGATIVGPGRMTERILPRHDNMAVTSIFPLGQDRALCAATTRTTDRKKVDLGLYTLDLHSGALTLLHNDPATAEFEPRPVMARPLPHSLPQPSPSNSFTASLLCGSTRLTRETITRQRGKLVRIVEGQPVTGRHHTHTSSAGEAWKNHVGTHARVLGTVPLAADGSFHVEIPADRLVHCQVLDSDRRVVGNQLIWMYARPGEVRSCVGCHEIPDTAGVSVAPAMPISARHPPLRCLPTGNEFSYRAKAWKKGLLPTEAEERTRTVNAISLPARQ